jgi:CxxC motif-containing protein (DUF1111 family)
MKLLISIIGLFILFACNAILPPVPANNEILEGPIAGLSNEEHVQFIAGDIAFSEHFTSQTGLGPQYVATSCVTCHPGDGKGHPFTSLTRLGQTTPDQPMDFSTGGPQLQNFAIPNHRAETLKAGTPFMKILPPAVTGLGYLAMVSDATLLDLEDPMDVDKDGISGRVHWIEPPSYFTPTATQISKEGRYIGRFGRKATALNLLHQTVLAYNQDMGILSSFEQKDPVSHLESDIEVANQTVLDLVFYLHTLKAPERRNISDPDVIAGELLFEKIQCGACHVKTLKTGPSSIPTLNEKEFHPYTDLLLHDMGPLLQEGVTEGSAGNAEWRTPPLWGLGLSKESQGGTYFLLHDGRTQLLESAIAWHGGEAEESRKLFQALSAQEQNQILSFLQSL